MSHRVLLAMFAHEDDLLAAVEAVREKGLHITDAFTPYAVHGLDRVLGLKPSRLTWVCFVCAMVGALGMLWFEHWTAAVSWPLDVGGKPFNSLPSDVPVAFEAAVLLAGFGSVFALFAVCRLFPGKGVRLVSPDVTNDRFVLVIDERDATFDLQEVTRLLLQNRAIDVQERVAAEGEVG